MLEIILMKQLGLLDFYKFLLNFRHWTYLWRLVIHARPLTRQRVAEGAVIVPLPPPSLIISIGFIISQDVTKWGLTRTVALRRANSYSSTKKVVMGSEAVKKKPTRMFSWQLCMNTYTPWWRTRRLRAATRQVVWRREAWKWSPLNPLCCLPNQAARRRIAMRPIGTGAATARSYIWRVRMVEGVASMHQTACEQVSTRSPASHVPSACCTIAWRMQKGILHSIHVSAGWWMKTVGAGGSASLCYRCWCPAYGATHHFGHVTGVACLVGSAAAGIVPPPSLKGARMKVAFVAGRYPCWVSQTGRW